MTRRLATFAAAIAGVAALSQSPAVAAPSGEVRCTRAFEDVPGIPLKRVQYTVTALRAQPAAGAVTCARGRAVIQRGFDRFGDEALSYQRFGELRMRIEGTRYVLAKPRPLASGSHAWRGGGTLVQYSLPTGT